MMTDARPQQAEPAQPLREYLITKLANALLTRSDIAGRIDAVDAAEVAAQFLLEKFEITKK